MGAIFWFTFGYGLFYFGCLYFPGFNGFRYFAQELPVAFLVLGIIPGLTSMVTYLQCRKGAEDDISVSNANERSRKLTPRLRRKF